MSEGNGNGSKFWQYFFDGIKNTWPLLVALVLLTSTFAGDRAKIMESIKSLNINLESIDNRLEKIEVKQQDLQLERSGEIISLKEKDSLILYRLTKIEDKVYEESK